MARSRERPQQIHERIERSDSLRVFAHELRLSRGAVLRFARAADVEQLLAAVTHRPSVIDDYRPFLFRLRHRTAFLAARVPETARQPERRCANERRWAIAPAAGRTLHTWVARAQ
ncbi:hypothetical protein [Streptomyces sp. NPDC002763]|uniref:hypothetical protein n=1 Tax=Streptomyces sp. NPDC002763 TaxID=3154427 RepID=UPI003319F7ED